MAHLLDGHDFVVVVQIKQLELVLGNVDVNKVGGNVGFWVARDFRGVIDSVLTHVGVDQDVAVRQDYVVLQVVDHFVRRTLYDLRIEPLVDVTCLHEQSGGLFIVDIAEHFRHLHRFKCPCFVQLEDIFQDVFLICRRLKIVGGVFDSAFFADQTSHILDLLLLWNLELSTTIIEDRVDAVLNEACWQSELEDEGSFRHAELDDVDVLRVSVLLEEELVAAYVPVGARLAEGALIDHLAVLCPHLEEVLEVSVELKDLLVDDLDQDGAEIARIVVLATRDHIVELVQRDRVHDLAHEVLGVDWLVVLEPILGVDVRYLLAIYLQGRRAVVLEIFHHTRNVPLLDHFARRWSQ